MVPASSHSLSCYVVESAEGSENVEDLHRPCCGLCVDGIWTGCFLGIVYRHICMEDSYSVCHFADDGDGNCPDGTDCEHESGYDRGSAGSLALVGMFLYARHRPDTVFCIGVRLYDGDSRTLHEQCGEASQTIKEEEDICLKN